MGNYYAGVMNSDYDSELKHHGILGQKWGIRRFQNPDGTLTPAGRERYGYSRITSSQKENILKSLIKRYSNKDMTEYDDNAPDGITGFYKDVYYRDATVNIVSKALGKPKDSKEVQSVSDEVGKEFQKIKYEKATGIKYSELMKDTDFSNLPKQQKAKAEQKLLDVGNSDSFDKEPQKNAFLHLWDRLICESGSAEYGRTVTEAQTKAMNELHDEYEKYDEAIHRYYRLSKKEQSKTAYPHLSERYWDLRNNIIPSIALKDIGYEDTKEAREIVEMMIFDD